ncbi:hypothetical protein CCACVL1_23703, partial [Corchorus capsularis]
MAKSMDEAGVGGTNHAGIIEAWFGCTILAPT